MAVNDFFTLICGLYRFRAMERIMSVTLVHILYHMAVRTQRRTTHDEWFFYGLKRKIVY